MRDGCVAVVRGAFFAFLLGGAPVPVAAQGVAIEVNPQAFAAIAKQCEASFPVCDVALKAFVQTLISANKTVPVSTVLASVVATIASDYNAGRLSAAVTTNMLNVAAADASVPGQSTLATAISVAQNNVANGDPIDLVAVAEGSESPT